MATKAKRKKRKYTKRAKATSNTLAITSNGWTIQGTGSVEGLQQIVNQLRAL